MGFWYGTDSFAQTQNTGALPVAPTFLTSRGTGVQLQKDGWPCYSYHSLSLGFLICNMDFNKTNRS